MQPFQYHWKLIIGFFLLVCITTPCQAQKPTRKERNAIKSIVSTIDRAGRQYRNKKFESSAEYFSTAKAMIEELSGSASPELMALIEPEHARLVKAFELLKEQGQEVDEPKALPTPMDANAEAISFRESVAPIIVAKCGRCHVQGNRGRFSAATYGSLMGSGHVDPGMPDVSRFIEVIEDGDMPPGGSLLDEELNTLKLWIKQGAKSDLPDGQGIAMTGVGGDEAPAELQVRMATGRETVSFSRDIAPVLVENCAGCHVDPGNNASGNLNMSTFRRLLRGGDNPPILVTGKGAESLLVKKLLGTGGGQRMPRGRPALKQKTIDLVTKWIDEGAKFDGGQATMSVRTVAARARAASLTHDELSTERKESTSGRWKIVMSDIDANYSETADLLVVSSYPQDRVDEVAELAQSLVPKIKAVIKGDRDQPIVKGRISVFVFERRYDFNEFGVMVEGREIPRQMTNRWGFDTVNAYVAMLMSRNQAAESKEASLARNLASTYVASLAPEVPRWFADGAGYWIAAKALGKSDEAEGWESAAEAAVQSMRKPDDFLKGAMPDDQAALVGYYFVQRLKSGNSSRFNRLLGMLKDAQPFEQSFQNVYGMAPEEFVGAVKKR